MQPWHLGVSSVLGGLVWTGEMASRRRMVTEVAGEGDVVPALATDSLTSNTTRMLGPLIGGALYQGLGLAAAYGVAAGCYLVDLITAFLVPDFNQLIHTFIVIPCLIAEVWMVGYLLAVGVKTDKQIDKHVQPDEHVLAPA